MPVKVKPTKEVKCRCGKTTIVDIEPATPYIKITRFVCDCGQVFHITDYMNGCITYWTPSKDVDEAYLENVEKNRKKCKYPMSEFYAYEDEVPVNTRVSTIDDCKQCDGVEYSQNEKCRVVDSLLEKKFCLVNETPNQKECFNHCPKCDAGEDDIDWGDKDWDNDNAWQNATCQKCGCEFTEVYKYIYTKIDK